MNNKWTLVYDYDSRTFKEKHWHEIKIGHIVKFTKNLEIPADIFILESSNKSGIVYVDTMNLDGETNLKEKTCALDYFNESMIEEYYG